MRKLLILLAICTPFAVNAQALKKIPRHSSWDGKSGTIKYQSGSTDTVKQWGLQSANDVIYAGEAANAAWKVGTKILPATTAAAAAWVSRNPLAVAGIIGATAVGVGLSYWMGTNGVRMSQDGTKFTIPNPNACNAPPCYEYRVPPSPYTWTTDAAVAAAAQLASSSTQSSVFQYEGPHPDGHQYFWYRRVLNGTPDANQQRGSLTFRTVTPESTQQIEADPQTIEDRLKRTALTPDAQKQIPISLPVEPVHNPDAAGNPQPIKSPAGSQQISDNPPRWRHREITVTPRPYSPSSPDDWEVDVRETTRESGSSDPDKPDPDPDPETEDPVDCVTNPKSPSCQGIKFGTLQPVPLQNQDRDVSQIEPVTGFPSGGQCPAPRSIQLAGRQVEFSLQLICDYASMIKPILIGFAWLAATMTFFGMLKRN